ncbi:hypothetical protein CTAYLR_002495 [Chrysophaeum taylorii]|uniref:NADAR domain-containing protein n=1 Tax=Chrysophaeum taylorii TaxID=2483200 RepID=A0AAD7XMK2_9STRA|nr:hypothetical protein CTAYLR_002495 [Chrysophaeum taylorii]
MSAIFFYGPKDEYGFLSQWYESPFSDSEGREFACAEQYMMFAKAELMGDGERAALILSATHPGDMKRLGRQVSPWDEEKWVAARSDIVEEGNFLKFSQSSSLLGELLATGSRALVEASPRDRIWGIGIGVKAAKAGAAWRGRNLLGEALVRVRERLRSSRRSRLAIDCGGVLSEFDTDAGDLVDRISKGAPTMECVKAVSTLVKLFGSENVFVLSKCRKKLRHATAAFLSNRLADGSENFYAATGLLPRNVVFCARRSGGSSAGLRFKPIDEVVDDCPFVPGPRVAVPDDVGKGCVAKVLGLTHLVDDRVDCLTSFWREGVEGEEKAVFLFGSTTTSRAVPGVPIRACPKGWSDVLGHFDQSPAEEESPGSEEPPESETPPNKRSKNKGCRVQSAAW